ncbi:MAG: 3-hydroxyacyl-CoA dehydrogenase family protein [Gemmatimonadaceae bacterium]
MAPVVRVAVIGAGTMGHGIAYVAAAAGYAVTVFDSDSKTLERGMSRIRASFEKGIELGKLTAEERDSALWCLSASQELAGSVAGSDLVIEAIPEQLALKKNLFEQIEPLVGGDTLLATNTSSLSITEIAASLGRRDRVLGLHFFNPVPAMRLIEIVRGRETSDHATETARQFAASLGKTAIVVRDSPGFATSRLGVVLGLEAIRMLEQEVASAEDIDRALELGYNHPMGPLRLTDVVGLDVRLAIAEHLHETMKDDTYRPPALLRDLVKRGHLGKKTGQGFYRWESES